MHSAQFTMHNCVLIGRNTVIFDKNYAISIFDGYAAAVAFVVS